MITPDRRARKPLWFHDFSAKHRREPSVMACPECGWHPQVSAAFCTRCGTDLLAAREPSEPLAVGSWTPLGALLSDRTTEPILGVRRPPPPQSTPVPRSVPTAHPSTPVKEMVGSERAEWIGRVWCSSAGVPR
jgi:hypothetical protein